MCALNLKAEKYRNMYRNLTVFCLACIFISSPVVADSETHQGATEAAGAEQVGVSGEETPREEEGHSTLHKLVWYIPDRALDLLDIVRLRVRVGPGLAVGVRATKVAQLYVGSYTAVYAGLPGPRRRSFPKFPIGLESYNGVAVSVAEATISGPIGPDYSPTEFGISLHPAIIGIDAGIDPVEIVDFLAGLLFIDLRDDDF